MMSEVARGGSAAASAGGVAHAAVTAEGAAGGAQHQPADSQLQPERQQGGSELSTAEEDEQLKYHQQMLYPTPGRRNYGFSDKFMMYSFKVEPCKRQEKHARGSCPFVHPGDVAYRRHPDAYQALLCPEVRAKKVCPRSNDCQCSHSAFEFWLHPDRYRTSLCEKGERCSRPVCFFAHNEKELRSLPVGLKPAAQTPEETAKRQGNSRASSVAGMSQSPGSSTSISAGLPGPVFGREGMPYMYMPGMNMAASNRPLMQRPPLPMVGPGYNPAAYGAGPYRGPLVPSPLEASMQHQYGGMMGAHYMPSSPMLSPGAMQAQGMAANGFLLGGGSAAAAAAAAAAAQHLASPVAGVSSRGSHSSGGNSSMGGLWNQHQQHQAQPPHARPGPSATTPTGSVQLPDDVLHQFQQLGVSNSAVTSQHPYDTPTGAMLPPIPSAGPSYGSQPVLYSPPGTEQGWGQQPLPLQQQRPPQAEYGLSQYAGAAVDPQHNHQRASDQQVPRGPAVGRVLPSGVGAAGLAGQQPAAQGGVFSGGLQGEAQTRLGHGWPAGGVGMLGPQDPSAAALVGAAMGMTSRAQSTTGPQQNFDAAGRW